jgi:S1-C subfamily serine protease
MARLGSSAIGDVLEFEVASENATRKVSLSVADLKIEPATVVVPDDFRSIGGMVVASISPGSPHYGEMRGAVIQNVTAGGLAHNAGLRAGDVIIEVNQRAISDVGQISDLIEDAAGISRVKISRQRVPFLVQFSR